MQNIQLPTSSFSDVFQTNTLTSKFPGPRGLCYGSRVSTLGHSVFHGILPLGLDLLSPKSFGLLGCRSVFSHYGLVLSIEDLCLREFTFSAISQSQRTILPISLTHSNSQDWCSGLNHLQDSKVEFTWGEISLPVQIQNDQCKCRCTCKLSARGALHEKIKNVTVQSKWTLSLGFASTSPKGLASYCKAETTFTFHFSILTL